jgi:argininosuccinate lyase
MADGNSSASDTLWHGRFDGGPAASLMAFTVSLPFDRRLWEVDIRGSKAHVRGLGGAGILSHDEVDTVLSALDEVASEFTAGTFEFRDGDEDIHTAVERRVTELAGDAGAKMHTARSRNDQVATDLRLWTKDAVLAVVDDLIGLQDVLVATARAHDGVYLPGYTHLQRAQPVLLAHHLLAHGWSFARDIDRLLDAHERMDVSPLGAGALAGTSLPISPSATARELGFGATFDNSLDAVSDRDFVAESLFDLAMVGIHLARIGEEWVLWSSEEFGFVRIDDAYATGSSMLPQKKNADIAELARGKSGRLIGNLTGLLTTLKGLPLAYNRDLQEDKEPLFDSVDQIRLAIAAVSGMIATATFQPEAMAQAADAEVTAATDLAEHLVRGGLPFRQAHAVVGRLVRRHLAGEGALVDLAVAEIGPECAELVRPGAGVQMRTSPGGAGPTPLPAQMAAFDERVAAARSRCAGRR